VSEAGDGDAVPSPCTGICTLDRAGTLCVGCWRTLDEIALWSSASDDRRRAILSATGMRRRAARG